MALRCQGGRRRIVPLDGDETAQETSLATMLARAWSWQKVIDEGMFANGKALARALGLDFSRVSRTLRLTRLSPAMVHRIITGDYPASLNSVSIRGSIPVDWDEQEKVLLQA